MSEFLHKNPGYGTNLKGICEETTAGVLRLKSLAKQHQLLYLVMAIDDAKSKYLFDNRYGTGQFTWTAIMHLTNMNIAVKIVVFEGYGWIKKGVVLRAKGFGAEVMVTEIDERVVREKLNADGIEIDS